MGTLITAADMKIPGGQLLFMENVLYTKSTFPDLPVHYSQNIMEGLLCCLELVVFQVFSL